MEDYIAVYGIILVSMNGQQIRQAVGKISALFSVSIELL